MAMADLHQRKLKNEHAFVEMLPIPSSSVNSGTAMIIVSRFLVFYSERSYT